MAKKDPRIDAYIEKSADFAKPILDHFRTLVHKTCPTVEETIKWNFPHFNYNGSMLCSMASFKQHCAIGFWKAELMSDAQKLVSKARTEEAMGHFGRISSLKDLPKDKEFIKYIKEGMLLNEKGITLPPKKAEIEIPDYFMKAISKNKKALQTFEAFAPSHKREYVKWVVEAKTEVTRQKRLAEAMEMMSEGKSKHWKYQ